LNFSGVKPAEYSGGRTIEATRDIDQPMNHRDSRMSQRFRHFAHPCSKPHA
jgi:hypothetical protein